MENEIRCPRCKEGKHLQNQTAKLPNGIKEKTIKDIRITKGKNKKGAVIEVNYGNGWEDIKEHEL